MKTREERVMNEREISDKKVIEEHARDLRHKFGDEEAVAVAANTILTEYGVALVDEIKRQNAESRTK